MPGIRRRSRLRRRKRLQRRAALHRTDRIKRRTPPRRSGIAPASDAQRAKVAGQRCLVCGERPADPAHLVPRSLGGCDEPDCVVPLCRIHHRLYDRGELDLLPHLEPGCRTELAHGLTHVGLLALLRRVTGAALESPVDSRLSSRRLTALLQLTAGTAPAAARA